MQFPTVPPEDWRRMRTFDKSGHTVSDIECPREESRILAILSLQRLDGEYARIQPAPRYELGASTLW